MNASRRNGRSAAGAVRCRAPAANWGYARASISFQPPRMPQGLKKIAAKPAKAAHKPEKIRKGGASL